MKLRVLLVPFLAPLLVATLSAQTVRVACVGDSITAGGYPGILDGLLPANYDVRNFGVSGATALAAGHGDLPYLSQPEYAAAVAFAPDIVIIKLGTNDSKAENWINRQYFDSDLAALATSFTGLSSHPQVFLCAPIPAMGTDYGIAPRVIETEIVPRVQQLRASLSGGRGIDCFTPFLGHPEYYDDRIHPNDTGRQLLAATIHAAVTAPVDTTPPGAPANSSATAATPTSVQLVWAAASGAPSGYFVYRDGVLVATVRATTFADTGLVPGTYTYSVRAFDAALNLGAAGPSAVVNTLGVTDTTPPTAPTGLAGHGISTSAISLSWTASTDNLGVSGYRIYRNDAGAPVGTVATPSFTDTGLAAGTTYAYRAAALDAAGNESARSAELTATTVASGTPVLNVPITIKECAGTGITDYPISVVIPLPRGTYQTTDALRLYNAAGVTLPCQFAVLNRWWATDNSIRHVTAQFQVSPAAFTGTAGSGTQTFYLRTTGVAPSPSQAVSVTESPSLVTVNTGPLRFTVNKGAGFNLFNELWLDANNDGTFAAAERLIAPSATNGGFLVPRSGAGATQNDSARNDISVTVEESGPLCAVLKIQALTNFTSTTNHLHGWAVRLYAYAGKPFVKVDYQLQNSALNAQFAWPLYFEEAGLRLGLSLGGAPTVTIGRGDGTFWQSPVNRAAYLAQEYHNRAAIYTRDAQNNPVAAQTLTFANGEGLEGFLDLTGTNGGVTATIRNFWQTWPNGLEARADSSLGVQLYPAWSCQYVNSGWNDAAPFFSPAHLYWLEDMQHAVKETLLYFHPPSTAPAEMSRLARTFMWHPVGVLSADWYGETKATLDLDGVVPAARPTFPDSRRIPYTYDNVGDVFGGYYATNYNIGWDNYLIDGRKFEASACGGWPPSVNAFVVSGAPGDYFTAEARAMGELNVRPHSMAGYSHAQHSAFLQLTENPYGSMSWRRFIDLDHSYLAAPYLPGTEQDARPRDDQHAWYYSVEQAYYFTANPWIRDWYAFIAEFRKTRLHQEDPLPDMETRALGHSLEHSLQAYRVTGDTELATLLAAYLENRVRPRQVQLCHGGRNHEPFTTADGVNHDHWDSPQIGFLSRFCANLLREIDDRCTDARAQAAADVFQFLAGCIEWNYHYGNFSGIDATTGARAAVPGDLGSNVIEPQAWFYRHTGIDRFWTHILGFTSLPQSTNYGHRPFDVFYAPWDGDYYERYYQYLVENPRTDTTPPAAVADLSAWSSGDTVTLRWTAPAGTDLARYHVVYANSPISATPTLATTATNWWAAKAIGTRLVPLPAATQQLTFTVAGSDPVYAAIYTFDSSDNMSAISNVAAATPGSPDTLPPSAPGSVTALPAGPTAIAVAWSASTDNIGVAGYRLYRDTTLVATTATTGFADTGLVAGTGYDYHVVAFDSAGNESVLSATATAVAHDEAFTTYATWRAGNFSGTDLTNNTVSGPLADPDGAGLTNLERFAFALPARGRTTSPVALTVTGPGSNQRLAFTFTRKGYAPGLQYVVQSSTDLATWTNLETVLPGYPKAFTFTDSVAIGSATRRFVRLRITSSP